MERRRLVASALTAAVLAACQPATPPEEAPASRADEGPELTMTGLRVQSYDATGMQWEMTAPKGEAFTVRAMMRVDKLHVQLFENREKSTDLIADTGTMYTGDPKDATQRVPPRPGLDVRSGDMYLEGNVVVVSTDGNRLSTDWVHFREADQIILSSAPVTMVRQNSISKGVGLRATPDLNRVEIYNQTLVIREDEGPVQ